jgi:hypothetical protein
MFKTEPLSLNNGVGVQVIGLAPEDVAVPAPEVRTALDVEQMMQEAAEATGLADYGDLGFVEALTKMVECYAEDGNLHAKGLVDFRQFFSAAYYGSATGYANYVQSEGYDFSVRLDPRSSFCQARQHYRVPELYGDEPCIR